MSESSRLSRRAALALPLLAAATPIGAPGQAAEPAVVGTVARLVGSASVQAEGAAAAAATPGMTVREGDRVTTAAGARVEILGADGTTITVGEATTLVLTTYLAPRGGRRGRGLLDTIEGILRIRLPGSWDRFEVTTGTAVASARSTDWIVDATAASTGVFVIEGRVQVASQAARTRGVLLEPGFGSDVAADGAPTPPRRWAQPRVDAAMARLRIP